MSAHRNPKRLPPPVRRGMNLTGSAHDRLRALNGRHGLGNNCLLVVLLERLDDYAGPERLNQVFEDFIADYGVPESRTAPDGRETDG